VDNLKLRKIYEKQHFVAQKDSYYRKPGQEVPKGLFSRWVDNKTDKGLSSS